MARYKIPEHWLVYVLKDPDTGSIRYVGWTSRTARCRFLEHIADAKRKQTTHRNKWIMSLLLVGKKPLIEVIEVGSGESWEQSEVEAISRYRALGCNLVNDTAGGEGVIGWGTPERRSEAAYKRARSKTPEQRSEIIRKGQATMTAQERHARAVKGHANRTPEQKTASAKKSAAAQTPEQRSEAARKRWRSKAPEKKAEHIAKMLAARHPAAYIDSAVRWRNKRTPEQETERRRKISEKLKGVPKARKQPAPPQAPAAEAPDTR